MGIPSYFYRLKYLQKKTLALWFQTADGATCFTFVYVELSLRTGPTRSSPHFCPALFYLTSCFYSFLLYTNRGANPESGLYLSVASYDRQAGTYHGPILIPGSTRIWSDYLLLFVFSRGNPGNIIITIIYLRSLWKTKKQICTYTSSKALSFLYSKTVNILWCRFYTLHVYKNVTYVLRTTRMPCIIILNKNTSSFFVFLKKMLSLKSCTI